MSKQSTRLITHAREPFWNEFNGTGKIFLQIDDSVPRSTISVLRKILLQRPHVIGVDLKGKVLTTKAKRAFNPTRRAAIIDDIMTVTTDFLEHKLQRDDIRPRQSRGGVPTTNIRDGRRRNMTPALAR